MRVLIADKDPYDLDAYRAALEGADTRVVTVLDGDTLEQLVVEHLPDVIVMGSSLGQKGGLALSRDLKSRASLGEIPEPKIVVLLEREVDGWLAAWSRCDVWRTKPVDGSELADLVRSLAGPQEAPVG